MKAIEIRPALLKGTIKAPPSKSIAHRAVICACLAGGISVVRNCPGSNDVSATVGAMRALGAKITEGNHSLVCDGSGIFEPVSGHITIDCGESGSTLRFMIPLACVSGRRVTFTGGGKLPERPLGPYFDLFGQKGIRWDVSAAKSGRNLPLTVEGSLGSGIFEIGGNISSQFISGLLLALPLCEGDSVIKLTSGLESAPYVDLTIDMMKHFGVAAKAEAGGFAVSGGQRYRSSDYTVEGDYSQAAFWLAAGALGSQTEVTGLNRDSLQGDADMLRIIGMLGYGIDSPDAGNTVRADPADTWSKPRAEISVDCSQIPDLVPVTAALAALTNARTVITGAARLRIKESDRLDAISKGLRALGADVTELPDGLVIEGRERLRGGTADTFNDHRIAMALAIAATRCEGIVTLIDHKCVDKSYPDFWEVYKQAGGNTVERDLGQ